MGLQGRVHKLLELAGVAMQGYVGLESKVYETAGRPFQDVSKIGEFTGHGTSKSCQLSGQNTKPSGFRGLIRVSTWTKTLKL